MKQASPRKQKAPTVKAGAACFRGAEGEIRPANKNLAKTNRYIIKFQVNCMKITAICNQTATIFRYFPDCHGGPILPTVYRH